MTNVFKMTLFVSLSMMMLLTSVARTDASDRYDAWSEWSFGNGFGPKSWLGGCGGIKNDEWEYMSTTHNDRNDVENDDNAKKACNYTTYIIDSILEDNVNNKQWFQGRFYNNYVGTHDFYSDRKNVEIEFLHIKNNENYSIWYATSLSNKDLALTEAVAVNRIKNIPDAGNKSFNGTVGFGGFKHQPNVTFASVDFKEKTVKIDAKFEGFATSVNFGRERFTVNSSDMKFHGESGRFEGEVVAAHYDVAGRLQSYTGRVSGWLGGDGGTQIALLYKLPWGHKSIDFFIGYAE